MGKLDRGLKALGKSKTSYQFRHPNIRLLETFQNPMFSDDGWGQVLRGTVRIVCPEFTSLCPKTGQPDFAIIVIEYKPDRLCVESKSLKLYLMGFRQNGEFHESCVHRIASDLVKVLRPDWLAVEGQFTPRGGIPFWPRVLFGVVPHRWI